MKKDIHPAYQQITITCACGNSFKVGSTSKEDIAVEICSSCHPFFTGRAKLIDAARRIDKFEARRKKTDKLKNTARSRKKSKKVEEEPEEENKES